LLSNVHLDAVHQNEPVLYVRHLSRRWRHEQPIYQ
jgi:hypothetical protein